MILLARIDKTHAVTLVLEFLWDGKDFPAIILALVFIGRRPNSRGDGYLSGLLMSARRKAHRNLRIPSPSESVSGGIGPTESWTSFSACFKSNSRSLRKD